MLDRELLSLEWVTDGSRFSSQCREVGTNGTSSRQARIPMVLTPEGSGMCCQRAKTVLPPCTLFAWECFKSSKLNSAIFIFRSICFMLIFGGFCSTISSILCILQPWEKYKTLQIKWTIIKAVECEFLYYIYMVFHKLQFSIVSQKLFPFGKTVTNLTCTRNRIICFDWFGEWIVQIKFVYNFSIICRLYIYICTFPTSNGKWLNGLEKVPYRNW